MRNHRERIQDDLLCLEPQAEARHAEASLLSFFIPKVRADIGILQCGFTEAQARVGRCVGG